MGPRDIEHHPLQNGNGPDGHGALSSRGILVKHPPSVPIHRRGPQTTTYHHQDNGGLSKKILTTVLGLLPITQSTQPYDAGLCDGHHHDLSYMQRTRDILIYEYYDWEMPQFPKLHKSSSPAGINLWGAPVGTP